MQGLTYRDLNPHLFIKQNIKRWFRLNKENIIDWVMMTIYLIPPSILIAQSIYHEMWGVIISNLIKGI